ncbi:MAG: putative lipid II flippase FtsW [Proteobacteria bacterium]|jgi:cell division protein FtsW|nr:putative lipid II flippase FtsW [Desulfobacterales bacterium]MBL7101513.1 putative lipid II flippase FtsW [Desulfobacteraceae bacterium]MBL7172439.1 putative lipid II flippase FtsW [Desulfobacteraceae bacterium]MBU0736040.1 putative lipid II flippase FtsW [Pseudomonadota bacterium]MBU1902307.1 putative lipid II flippase FtsW [Pseudomonadota bacterium]
MGEKKAADSGYDYMLLIPAILLVTLGLVIVYSASSNLAEHRLGDSYFYLKRQALFCLIGIALMVMTRYIPCTLYSKLVYPLLLISLSLLLLLFVPGLGHKVGGACRWISLGNFSFQPSELAKFTLAVYMAYSMSKKGTVMESFSKGLLPHLIVAGAFMFLIVLQPDLGTAVIVGAWVLIALFVGGVRIFQLLSILLLFAPVVAWLILNADYRLKRWLAFMNPWDDPKGIGFQIIHSFLAFGSGGIFGAGLGNSKQKLFYLPEPHTDFALSIMGEELGLLGVASIIVLFGILIMGGIRVALKAKDLYSTYLALGLTAFIGLQVLINMGVVMGLLPTKGLTLPLISYGGSSLVITLASIGVLLNISSKS